MDRAASKVLSGKGRAVASAPTHSIERNSFDDDVDFLPIERRRRETSTPTTRWPVKASGRECLPWPQPTSRTRSPAGMSVMKSTTSGHGSTRAWAYDSAIRSYVVRTSALDRPIPGTRRYLRIKSRSGPEGGATNLLGRTAPDVIERRERSDRPAAIQVLREGGRHFRAARRARPNADLVGAVLRATLEILPSAELPAFGCGLSFHLDDVHRKIDRRGVAQARADTGPVSSRLRERGDRSLVHRAGHEDLYVLVAAEVELPADLPHDRGEVAAARGRRIESHSGEIWDRFHGEESFRLFVVVGVDQGDARDLRLEVFVDRRERLPRTAHHDYQGVGHRPHRGRSEQFGSERRRDRVDSGDVHGSLDEGRDPGVHAPNPEGEDLLVSRELPDPGGLRGDATRLTDHPEDRSFVERPLCIRSLQHHDRNRNASRRTRRKKAPLQEGPEAHGLPLQQMHGLLHAAEDAPGPPARQVAGGHLGDDRGALLARLLQDVHGPEEVDVRGLAGLNLLRGGDVEVTTLRIAGHRLVSGYFLCLLELLLSARAAWARVIVGRETLPQAPHPG